MGLVFVELTLVILQKDECPLLLVLLLVPSSPTTLTVLPGQWFEEVRRPKRTTSPRYLNGLESWSIPDAFRGFANWLAGVATREEAHACVGEWQIPDTDSVAGLQPDCRSLRQLGPAHRIR